jgi:hypothetical protein
MGTWFAAVSDPLVEATNALKCAAAEVYVDGVQHSDGAVEWSLYVLADDREPLTSDQARPVRGDDRRPPPTNWSGCNGADTAKP